MLPLVADQNFTRIFKTIPSFLLYMSYSSISVCKQCLIHQQYTQIYYYILLLFITTETVAMAMQTDTD